MLPSGATEGFVQAVLKTARADTADTLGELNLPNFFSQPYGLPLEPLLELVPPLP